jgi:transposase
MVPSTYRGAAELVWVSRACLLNIRLWTFEAGCMVRANVVSDELWSVIEPVVATAGGRRGRPWNDHRLTLEGICWRFRTGSPWRDLPVEFGAWQSVWERHRRWSADGSYERMFAAVKTATGAQDAGSSACRRRPQVEGRSRPHRGRCRVTSFCPASRLITRSDAPEAG